MQFLKGLTRWFHFGKTPTTIESSEPIQEVPYNIHVFLWKNFDVVASVRPTIDQHRAFVERAEQELKVWTTNWPTPGTATDDYHAYQAYLRDLKQKIERMRQQFLIESLRGGRREGINPPMGCV